eukprot:CAMPEP_0177592582 /NCGR_PEP_ID=MMETSP0419_2-20121207/8642_1 /TAXON_ID=582737 /ORGANISM="Tetraselmis sp., Strain GSL018" /LENGTH=171 /DNA_ID=CAMNT_0019083469 /DNA_START=443 /DNA_END=958 /DNA_ORIENTATION=+
MNLAREDIEDSESSTYIGVPSPRRALGVDYGRKFTGLAVSSGGFAPRELSPLRTPRSLQQLAGEIVVIAERERVDCVIVGLPVTRRGLLNKPETDSQQGRRCRNLAFTLAAVAASSPTGLEILLCDETDSSTEAGALLGSRRRNTSRLDSMSACIILERYFDFPGGALPVR